ncbi:MAG: MaoC family dehydratase N-terminal domain-containing protein [Pseudaminobacter sp.]
MGIDIEHLRRWIGRIETATDIVSERLVTGFQATLGEGPLRPGDIAPLAIHWCLAPAMVPPDKAGRDGHPAKGGFLPPVSLPRRMWAGGSLRFHDALRVGDEVTRVSRIAEVTAKTGRSGQLCFVSVEHEFRTGRSLAIMERQDIVYRDSQVHPSQAKGEATGAPAPEWQHSVRADTLLLFRYSALTFNGHRIHYDHPYATGVEGYPGLVVHGPLQATLLLQFAARIRGECPQEFSYRGLRPMFDGEEIRINARPYEGGLKLWTADRLPQPAMAADATWGQQGNG